MKMKIILITALLGIGVISVHGQNKIYQNNTAVVKTQEADISYTDFMKQLGEKKSIAKIKKEQQFILTSEYTFLDHGKKLSIEADVYLVNKDKVIKLTTLSGGGTAYPIAVDEKGFYAASGHSCSYYELQGEALVMVEQVAQCYDEKGMATYEVIKDGKKIQGSAEDFEAIFNRYLKAEPVIFNE